MKKIKFRGYHIDEVGEPYDLSGWKYGDLIYNKNPKEYLGIGYYIKDEDNFFWKVEQESVGQYIGFNDKNNIEIYEKDIIKRVIKNSCYDFEREPSYFEVIYNRDIASFVLRKIPLNVIHSEIGLNEKEILYYEVVDNTYKIY